MTSKALRALFVTKSSLRAKVVKLKIEGTFISGDLAIFSGASRAEYELFLVATSQSKALDHSVIESAATMSRSNSENRVYVVRNSSHIPYGS